MEKLEILKSLMKDIYLKKFKKIESIYDKNKVTGKLVTKIYHDINLIKKDKRYNISRQLLHLYYYEKEYGIKYMIKYLELPISYSVLRMVLINIFDIKLRNSSEITNHLYKIRKENALDDYKNKRGWSSEECVNKVKSKNSIKRGIQGYYFNNSINKYVWLRSSWEYIYAKWLDNKNIIWDVEYKTYYISDTITYRPDFFIFDDKKNIKQIVEVKGYWKNKLYKYEALKIFLNEEKIEFSLITNITAYSELGVKNDSKEWKEKRILNL